MAKAAFSIKPIFWEFEKAGPERAGLGLGQLRGCSGELLIIQEDFDRCSRRHPLGERGARYSHYLESYYARAYAIRERAWDVLKFLADVKGRSGPRTSDRVLDSVRQRYPSVAAAWDRLMGSITADIRARNLATHDIGVDLCLFWGDEVLGEAAEWITQLEEDAVIRRRLRSALARYARDFRAHLGVVASASLDFYAAASKHVRG